MDVGRVDDLVAILGTEPRRRTELPHLGPDDARVREERNAIGVAVLPVGSIVLVRPEVEHLLRAGIKRIEIGAGDRPAAVRHPVALLEIDRLVGGAPAGPVSGAAAKVVERRGLEWIVRLADYLTAIELLHLRIEVESTALEQQHLEARVG